MLYVPPLIAPSCHLQRSSRLFCVTLHPDPRPDPLPVPPPGPGAPLQSMWLQLIFDISKGRTARRIYCI